MGGREQRLLELKRLCGFGMSSRFNHPPKLEAGYINCNAINNEILGQPHKIGVWDVGQTMENMKRQLVESGIIGGVVDDFDPLLELTLCYKNKQIRFGEGATHVEIVHMPTMIQHETYENFTDRNLAVLVMTDPDAPGGEYLQWLTAYFFVRDGEEEILEDDIIYYEPPRGDARKIVVTIFNTSIESLPSILALKSEKKREGFSTKGFATHHKLGMPVAVTFFNIETSEANRASAPKPKRNKSTN